MFALLDGTVAVIDRAEIRILVLDDDPFMLKLLRRMLASQGYVHVVTCESGRAALERVERPESLPQLILCDLNMPEMDGAEFARELVARHYSGSLILVSGEDERVLEAAEKLVRAHSIRVLGRLGKPVSATALAALLEKWSSPLQVSSGPAMLRRADEVHAAINNGQLVNHYQPKVAVASGRVVGVEALVRWMHPQDGMVHPEQFISVAEEHGLIDDLTRVVVKAALTQVKAWHAQGLTLDVAINVSMDTLAKLDFPDSLARQAVAAGVAPRYVVVEVTESRLMADLRAPLEVLTRLRLKGFRLSIDDFGTGHSSLANLRDLPFDELKVDRGFVHRAGTDRTLRAMYDAILGLAKQLGINVVAEGVEDREDWAFLRQTSCDYAQGYFIGRPIPAAELPAWIHDWQARSQSDLSP